MLSFQKRAFFSCTDVSKVLTRELEEFVEHEHPDNVAKAMHTECLAQALRT